MSNVATVRADQQTAFDAYDLVVLFWRERITLLVFTLLGLGAGVAVALLLPPIFRAEATVQVRAERAGAGALQALAGELGPLGALAGAAFGGNGDEKGVALATLQSRAIVQSYIERQNLLPLLYERQWDRKAKRWKSDDPDSVPTSQKAYRKFKEKIFGVEDDKKSGLVIVSVEWKDPVLAARWLNDLIADTNAMLKNRTIRESEASLRYLETQAKNTTIVELRIALYTLMEAEYKKLMIARNTEDYVLRIIDPAQVPKNKVRPQRGVIVALSSVLGLAAGLAFVILLSVFRKTQKAHRSSATAEY